jgi:hypothetical protein
VRGRERPEEVVLLGAHLDSWDLGQGAVDDGAGVALVMEALQLVARERPRRTVRAVLFANEENGTRGGKAYAAAHAAELPRHVAALEADSGAGRALSVAVEAGPGAADRLAPWLAALTPLGCGRVEAGHAGGTDIEPAAAGPPPVPMVQVRQDTSRYFDVHHAASDTLEQVQPQELAHAAAAVALVAWALAEQPEPLQRVPPASGAALDITRGAGQ